MTSVDTHSDSDVLNLSIDSIEFRQGGLTVVFEDGREVIGDFRIINGVLEINGFSIIEEQALRHFNENQISVHAQLDPRLANIDRSGDSASDFQIIVIPPTDLYAIDEDPILPQMIQWVRNNKIGNNIRFVTHVGDIANFLAGGTSTPFVYAFNSLTNLEFVIPYSYVAGDLDYNNLSTRDLTDWIFYFGPETLSNHTWQNTTRPHPDSTDFIPAIPSPSGSSSYQFFKANNRTFMHLSLELEAANDLSWANIVLENNCEKPTIISTHRYLNNDGTRSFNAIYDGFSPQTIWKQLVTNNANVFMVLSGDDSSGNGEGFNVDVNSFGFPVWEINSNFNNRDNNGNGFIRLITFREASDRIDIDTYSTNLLQFDESLNTDPVTTISVGVDFEDRFDANFCSLTPLPDESSIFETLGNEEDFDDANATEVTDPSIDITSIESSILWFTNASSGQIEKALVDQTGISNRQVVYTGFINIGQIEIDRRTNKIYWIADGCIFSGQQDGTGQEKIIQSSQGITGLVLDTLSKKIYYSLSGQQSGAPALLDGQIKVVDYDGNNDTLLVSSLSKPISLAIDEFAGVLFWNDLNESNNQSTIYRYVISTSISTIIINPSDIDGFYGIRVHKGELYLARQGADVGGLYRTDYNGHNILQIVDDNRSIEFNPRFFEIDSFDNVYFNVVDGPDSSFYSNSNNPLSKEGFGYGFTRTELNQVIIGQFDFYSYLGFRDVDSSVDPINEITDFFVISETELTSNPTGDINDILLIDANGKLIYEINLDSELPINIEDVTDKEPYRTFLEGDCPANITGIVIDDRIVLSDDDRTRRIYYTEGASDISPPANTVRSLLFAGENSTQLLRSPISSPQDIIVDTTRNKLYIATPNSIMRSNIDGSNLEILIAEGLGYSNIEAMAWDQSNSLLFWVATRANKSSIFKGSNTNTGGFLITESSFSTVSNDVDSIYVPESIAIDPNNAHIFWANVANSHVYRMNYDGSGIVKIDLENHNPRYLRIDPIYRKLYWTELSQLWRSNLDGSTIELVVVSSGFSKRFDVNQIDTSS